MLINNIEFKSQLNTIFIFMQFLIDGIWHTWIDYDRFHHLNNEFTLSQGAKTFSSLDYAAPTPCWACFGASEQGFDPSDLRFYRKNKAPIRS